MVGLSAAETWVAYADAVAFASAKHHISIHNATGSGVIAKLRKLFAINLQTATVTGVVGRFDWKDFTAAHTGGTAITPRAMDSTNAALPAGLTVKTNATVTPVNTRFPWITSSEEETAVVALSKAIWQQSINILMESPESQEETLREGEGRTMQQVGTSTVGSFGWILVFTVETP